MRLGDIFHPTVKNKRNLMGLAFIAPWIIGVTIFFIIPMIQSMVYVFYDVQFSPNGNGTVKTYLGLEIIRDVLFRDPDNVRMMISSIATTLGEVLLIISFSLFLAIILSQKFHGNMVARAIFALPIIVSSGVLLEVFKQDLFTSSLSQTSDVTIFQSQALEMSMLKLGLDPSIISTLTGLVSNILDLLWKCGVQILLFLGGIKSIPKQLYEVCDVEGANAWQTFWKVTFPMVTPYILLNTVYSIIDSFTYYANTVMQRIQKYFTETYYSSATTLAVSYCLFVLVVTGIVSWFVSRKVYYIEK